MEQRLTACDRERVLRGWELLCLATVSIPPTKNFENYLWNFLHAGMQSPDAKVSGFANYCMRKLQRTVIFGVRRDLPKPDEIRRLSVRAATIPCPHWPGCGKCWCADVCVDRWWRLRRRCST
jgi:hypothetical protein